MAFTSIQPHTRVDILRYNIGKVVHKYNNKGEVESMTSTYKVVEDVYFYSDYKYDDHGNWIERKVTTVYDGENKSEIETRTITYYE